MGPSLITPVGPKYSKCLYKNGTKESGEHGSGEGRACAWHIQRKGEMEADTEGGESHVKTEAAMRQETACGATRLENTGVFSQSPWMDGSPLHAGTWDFWAQNCEGTDVLCLRL